MKWDVQGDNGTFTSITAYDDLDEILTGDAFDFRPLAAVVQRALRADSS